MARSDAFSQKAQSPVKKYISWASNEKCFMYYDRELKIDRKVELPITLVYFDSFASIKGFHDPSQSSIYSNEVKSTKNEILTVRSFKVGDLVSGLYQDIKSKVDDLGGHYNASIYAMLDGEIVNISMKGAVLQHWSDFGKANFKKFLTNEILINTHLDAKKGSVKYSVPVFELGGEISKEDSVLGDKLYDELAAYFVARKSDSASYESTAVEAEVESNIPTFAEPEIVNEDDNTLPF